MPTAWMRFVIRADIGEKLIAFCSQIGAESVTDGLESLLLVWNEVTKEALSHGAES